MRVAPGTLRRRRGGRARARRVLLALLLALSARVEAGGILSLGLCTDWLLAYHARPEQVVALSPLYRQNPLPVAGRSWPTHEGSLEQIYRLHPDLVLASEFSAPQLRRRLQTLGVRVEVLPLPRDLAGIERNERRLLELLGQSPDRARAAPAARTPAADAPRLLLLGANGIGTGTGTFEDRILRQAGWRNYLAAPGYQALDLEQLVRDPPDGILTAAPRSPALANRFAALPLLQRLNPPARWLDSEAWRWQCPGPWTWDLIEQLQP